VSIVEIDPGRSLIDCDGLISIEIILLDELSETHQDDALLLNLPKGSGAAWQTIRARRTAAWAA
jgi:hypothetical protein